MIDIYIFLIISYHLKEVMHLAGRVLEFAERGSYKKYITGKRS